MQIAKIISHTLDIEYTCPEDKEKHVVFLDNPRINEGQRYEDDIYRWTEFRCPFCKKDHMVEL